MRATSEYLNREPRPLYDALSHCVGAAIVRGDATRVSDLNVTWKRELMQRVDSVEKRALAAAARLVLGLSW